MLHNMSKIDITDLLGNKRRKIYALPLGISELKHKLRSRFEIGSSILFPPRITVMIWLKCRTCRFSKARFTPLKKTPALSHFLSVARGWVNSYLKKNRFSFHGLTIRQLTKWQCLSITPQVGTCVDLYVCTCVYVHVHFESIFNIVF